jgi:hypothetical protein
MALRQFLAAFLAGLLLFGGLVRADHALQVQGTNILDRGTPVRGFYAFYGSTPRNRAEIESTLDAMKDLYGLKGFSIDVGWRDVEGAPGQYGFPTMTEQILEVAVAKGLSVNIHLVGHYTPSWAYEQDVDIWMKDANGSNATGNWLNYAPSSPAALQWQGEFQRRAVQYYKTKPAVTSFNLTNELTYGTDAYIDYSSWASNAWNAWRQARSLSPVSMPRPSEAASRAADWQQWQLFRQDQLNNYFNTVYSQAKSGLAPGDDELLFHRHNWYQASGPQSSQQGIYLDPRLQTGADVTGGNIYGMNALEGAMMRAGQRPVFVTETNHPGLSTSSAPPSPGRLNRMYLEQFFEGAHNQTIYQFGGSPAYPMRNDDGTVHPSYLQFKAMAEKVGEIGESDLTPQRQVGYLWPRNFAAVNADEQHNLRTLHNEMMRTGRRIGETGLTIYPSSFDPSFAADPVLGDVDLIYALRHYGFDQATLNSDRLREWVSAGGTLVVELSPGASPPSWAAIGVGTTTRSRFSTNASSPFGVQENLQKNEAGITLSNLTEVWATWDKPTQFSSAQNAMGMKTVGQGKVVIIGTNSFTHSFEPVIGMGHYVFGDEGLNESFEYYRIGHNLLAEPTTGAGGVLTIPTDWLTPMQSNYLMDMESGVFQPTSWTLDGQGNYQFDVPANSLLLSIAVPEPSASAALLSAGLLVARCRNSGKHN